MAGALRQAREVPPPGLLAELDAAVLEGLSAPTRRRPMPRRALLTGAAAALLLAVLARVPLPPGGVAEPPGRLVTPAPTTGTEPSTAEALPEPAKPAAPEPEPSPAPLAGDLNGDGVVDIADARMIQQIVVAGLPAPAGADANGDGLVDVADVRHITRHEVAAR
jgi:hypothetical protein